MAFLPKVSVRKFVSRLGSIGGAYSLCSSLSISLARSATSELASLVIAILRVLTASSFLPSDQQEFRLHQVRDLVALGRLHQRLGPLHLVVHGQRVRQQGPHRRRVRLDRIGPVGPIQGLLGVRVGKAVEPRELPGRDRPRRPPNRPPAAAWGLCGPALSNCWAFSSACRKMRFASWGLPVLAAARPAIASRRMSNRPALRTLSAICMLTGWPRTVL